MSYIPSLHRRDGYRLTEDTDPCAPDAALRRILREYHNWIRLARPSQSDRIEQAEALGSAMRQAAVLYVMTETEQ